MRKKKKKNGEFESGKTTEEKKLSQKKKKKRKIKTFPCESILAVLCRAHRNPLSVSQRISSFSFFLSFFFFFLKYIIFKLPFPTRYCLSKLLLQQSQSGSYEVLPQLPPGGGPLEAYSAASLGLAGNGLG